MADEAKPGVLTRLLRGAGKANVQAWRVARRAGGLAALLVAFLALVLVADVVVSQLQSVWRVRLRPPGGFISVESPEVYSRERLLNDRREQAEWLSAQLTQTRNDDYIKAIDALTGRVSERRLSVLGEPPSTQPESQDQRRPEVALMARERLRAIAELREELRGERLQALLDDRHDIAGNTLHQLAFDVTVARERGEQRLGLVLMRLRVPRLVPEGRNERTMLGLVAADFERAYGDWIEELKREANEAVLATASDLRANSLERSAHVDLVAMLTRTLHCETGTQPSDRGMCGEPCAGLDAIGGRRATVPPAD